MTSPILGQPKRWFADWIWWETCEPNISFHGILTYRSVLIVALFMINLIINSLALGPKSLPSEMQSKRAGVSRYINPAPQVLLFTAPYLPDGYYRDCNSRDLIVLHFRTLIFHLHPFNQGPTCQFQGRLGRQHFNRAYPSNTTGDCYGWVSWLWNILF